MRILSAIALLAVCGCAFGPQTKFLPIESTPPGVDIYSRAVRYVYGDQVDRAGLQKCGTTPFQLPVIGQGEIEVWAVKDGRLLVMNIDVAQQAPVKFDFSRAVPLKQEEKVCLEGKVYVGMPEAYARISWGDPHDIHATTTRSGRHEQWVYGSHNYLYVENGKVTSIQN